MAPDDRPAAKRPRSGYSESAGLRATASAIQNRSIAPVTEPHLPVELIAIILKLRFPKAFRWKEDMAEIYGLRLVSRLWKELIEDTPWFWTVISADWPTRLIQDCLQLSRNHLLQVEAFSSWINEDTKGATKKFQLFQPHAERWEKLDYNTDRLPASEAQQIRDILESAAPNLQSLYASLPKPRSSPAPTLNLAGGKANRLKHLGLENILVPWSSQLLTELETFSLKIEGTVPMTEIVTIFIKNPGLRSFDLSYQSIGGPDLPTLPASADSNLSQVTANALEEVNLCVNDPRTASHILSQVSMPACRSLKLVVESRTIMKDLQPLNVALSQFSAKIEHAISQCGRTTFYVWSDFPHEWTIRSHQDSFQLSLAFSGSPLEHIIECIRNLALQAGSQLKLEVYLNTMSRWIADKLGWWSEITKLHVTSIYQSSYDPVDEWWYSRTISVRPEWILVPDYPGRSLTSKNSTYPS
ncbi:hypothetical protein FS837_010727 [Tulasnella sp. UAMH 9824]|nr:hypothetical protein FS837_010727 [Tulasnella sp. UAMH 9824]